MHISEHAEMDQELGRWQEAIRNLLVGLCEDDSIDGGGCDSGDPLDVTLTEISQAFAIIKDREADAHEG